MMPHSLGSAFDWQNGCVEMRHGSGGRASAQLIEELFIPAFNNAWLGQGNDGTVLPPPAPGHRLVMTTDAHVVSPLFFPGGDIGCLAVHGTVNDVVMMGAQPLWLSAGFILEEGLLLNELRDIVHSMSQAARSAGVAIVCGDTKVVERGKGDGLYIAMTGVGQLAESTSAPAGDRAQPGDAILISGTLGDHGIAILTQREGLQFDTPIQSDTAALNGLVAELQTAGIDLHVLRDPTRGGLATTLNEIARQSGVGILLDEASIPIQPAVAAACEFMGLDPLYIANEGKMVVICAPEHAATALRIMQSHPLGKQAAIIGRVIDDRHRFIQLQTRMGGQRLVDWLNGDPLPRIC
ncbi:MAG: hydrogenase expression/formation protein HypE [Pseudomonadota bacterium]